MNDRFKARIWLQSIQVMDYFNLYEKSFESKAYYLAKDCPIMQCTGLKDKLGTLVYESDIVKNINCYGHTNIFIIEWSNYLNNCGDCFNKSGPGFDFKLLKSEDLEIIGNRFENPELLEQK